MKKLLFFLIVLILSLLVISCSGGGGGGGASGESLDEVISDDDEDLISHLCGVASIIKNTLDDTHTSKEIYTLAEKTVKSSRTFLRLDQGNIHL